MLAIAKRQRRFEESRRVLSVRPFGRSGCGDFNDTEISSVPPNRRLCAVDPKGSSDGRFQMVSIAHDGSMVLLYMVTWIPSIYPLYVSIYTSTMDPSWVLKWSNDLDDEIGYLNKLETSSV